MKNYVLFYSLLCIVIAFGSCNNDNNLSGKLQTLSGTFQTFQWDELEDVGYDDPNETGILYNHLRFGAIKYVFDGNGGFERHFWRGTTPISQMVLIVAKGKIKGGDPEDATTFDSEEMETLSPNSSWAGPPEDFIWENGYIINPAETEICLLEIDGGLEGTCFDKR